MLTALIIYRNLSQGIFIGGIDIARPLWVIVDVYGTATAVAFGKSDSEGYGSLEFWLIGWIMEYGRWLFSIGLVNNWVR